MAISPTTTATNLIQKFNVSRNDNKAFSGWTMQEWTTRTVLGAAESKKILAEIKKLPVSQQKAVLRAIAGRVDKEFASVGGLYIQPGGVTLFEKAAARLGLKTQFDGVAQPPMVMG